MVAPRILQVGANPIITPAPQASRGNLALSQALTNAAQNKRFTPGASGALEGADVLGKAGTGALVKILAERKAEERAGKANETIASIIAQKNAESALLNPQNDAEALKQIAGAQASGTLPTGGIRPDEEKFFTPEQRPGRVEVGLTQNTADNSNFALADALNKRLENVQQGRGQMQDPAFIAAALNNGVPPQLLVNQGQPKVDPNTQARIASNERIAANKIEADKNKSQFKKVLSPEGFEQEKKLREFSLEGAIKKGVAIATATNNLNENSETGQLKRQILEGKVAKQKIAEEKTAMRAEAQRARAAVVNGKIDEANALIDKWLTTGILGNTLKMIGGTDARNLSGTIDTIKGILGFSELQAMRDASPTGGALGQVAVRELELLQSTIASLDQGQSAEVLKRNLEQVRTHINNWGAAVRQSGSPTQSNVGQQNNERLLKLQEKFR